MEAFKCDHCGELKEGKPSLQLKIRSPVDEETIPGAIGEDTTDLCHSCSDEVMEFLRNKAS